MWCLLSIIHITTTSSRVWCLNTLSKCSGGLVRSVDFSLLILSNILTEFLMPLEMTQLCPQRSVMSEVTLVQHYWCRTWVKIRLGWVKVLFWYIAVVQNSTIYIAQLYSYSVSASLPSESELLTPISFIKFHLSFLLI